MLHKLSLKCSGLAIAALLALPATGLSGQTLAGAMNASVFDTPEEAAAALADVARNKNLEGILEILGPETEEWIISGDPVQDEQGRERFIGAYDQKHAIEMEGDDLAVLVIGEDNFPFPFPIVKLGTGWAFDAEEGRQELLDRRIGENELDTIQVLLAIVDAQNEYASEDRDGDGLLEYASRFGSSEGQHDGLYWPVEGDEPPSPLGPLVADASAEGYTPRTDSSGEETAAPYHGYRYRLLFKQGTSAVGGAYDYRAGEHQVGGFAVLAYPENYGVSGIMTLMTNHDGTVYEADLGPDTQARAQAIEEFDPGAGWAEVATQ